MSRAEPTDDRPCRDSGNGQGESDLKALTRRAEAILRRRPAYKEMVDFYLGVFRRQIEWRPRIVVHPEPVDTVLRCRTLASGTALVERFAPGLDLQSLRELWEEMKALFRTGNPVLREAVAVVEGCEGRGDFSAAPWLAALRPDRPTVLTETAAQLGVDAGFLGALARAVTFPHWHSVARQWLPAAHLDDWKVFRCPTCGATPALAETRTSGAVSDGIRPTACRYMHCAFCGSRWDVPALRCPSCASCKPGDAKYLFTAEEPELRVDYCNGCRAYLKLVDGDKIAGPIHVGLELLTSLHLDVLAQEKDLSPLDLCA